MKYVISDIHGEYEKFIKILKLINFSDEDTLYILGDVIDRGEKSLDVMDIVMDSDNIHMIKGNHEQMMLDYYKDRDRLDNWFDTLWVSNGGNMVMRELRNRTEEYLKRLRTYIFNLPNCLIVDNYILVHAGIYVPPMSEKLTVEEIISCQEEDILLWDRSFIEGDRYIEGYTVICGHSPVQGITNNIEDVSILKKCGKIIIDCGAVFKDYNGKLACLRLDDMEEFYA